MVGAHLRKIRVLPLRVGGDLRLGKVVAVAARRINGQDEIHPHKRRQLAGIDRRTRPRDLGLHGLPRRDLGRPIGVELAVVHIHMVHAEHERLRGLVDQLDLPNEVAERVFCALHEPIGARVIFKEEGIFAIVGVDLRRRLGLGLSAAAAGQRQKNYQRQNQRRKP